MHCRDLFLVKTERKIIHSRACEAYYYYSIFSYEYSVLESRRTRRKR